MQHWQPGQRKGGKGWNGQDLVFCQQLDGSTAALTLFPDAPVNSELSLVASEHGGRVLVKAGLKF